METSQIILAVTFVIFIVGVIWVIASARKSLRENKDLRNVK